VVHAANGHLRKALRWQVWQPRATKTSVRQEIGLIWLIGLIGLIGQIRQMIQFRRLG
jgi:hypothetical protein